MTANNDALVVDKAVGRLMEVSEEIGQTTEQIEKVKEKQYIAVSKGICDPTYQYRIDDLTCYRDELDVERSRARIDVYKKFENYYTGAN